MREMLNEKQILAFILEKLRKGPEKEKIGVECDDVFKEILQEL